MARIAVVQMESITLDPAANLERVSERMMQASRQEAGLAIFPECVLTGYVLTAEEAHEIAEQIPGPRTEQLVQVCRQTGLLAAVGTIEKDALGNCFNSLVLLGPQGVLGSYRKSHLPFLGVDRFLAAGDQIGPPIETGLARLGLLICYDIRFPEPTRALALEGAQIVLLSTAWPQAATLYPDYMVQSRAAENSVYLAAADRVGVERGQRFLGRSLIVAPDGTKLAEAGSLEEELLIVDVDPMRAEDKNRIFIPGQYELHTFEDRRPELYGRLTQPVEERDLTSQESQHP